MIKQAFLRITSIILNRQPGGLNYAKGAFWLFADKGIKLLAELLVGFYLARYLGAGMFGLLNFAISYVILFQGISTLGLNDVLVRELINDPSRRKSIVSTALMMRVTASVAFIVILQVIAMPFGGDARILILVISASLLFRSFEIFTPYFQAIVKGEWVAFIQIAVTVAGSALKIACIALEKDLIWFAAIYSIEWLILGAGLLLVYVRNRMWTWGLERTLSLKLLKSSWYLMLSAAAVNLYMRIDQVMIRQLVDDAANGHYSAAVRLSEIWYIFPTILCAILFPAILNARNKDADLYRSRLIFLNSFLFWFSTGIAVCIAPLSETLVVWLYGADYRPAGEILSYHIWSGIFVYLGVCSGYWLIAENLEKLSLFRTLAGLVLNLALNFLLIPVLGATGAAIATLFSQAMAALVSMVILPASRAIVWLQFESIIFPFVKLYAIIVRNQKPTSH